MSFIPADEEDEYDSEECYWDEDSIFEEKPKYYKQIQNCEKDHGREIHNHENHLNFNQNGLNSHISGAQELDTMTKMKEMRNGNSSPAKETTFFWDGLNSPSKHFVHRHTSNTPKFMNSVVYTMEDLKYAIFRGNSDLAIKCLSQGLPLNEPYRDGWSALMYAANYANPKIIQLLLEKGADPSYQYDMFTTLMSACLSNNTPNEEDVAECVKILLTTGADINAQDRMHTTPLMLASKEGHLTAVKQLIKHEAEVNKQDTRGWTALTWAAQRGRKDIVMVLLEAGADPNIKHQDKLTVKDLAANLPTDEILALLEHRTPKIVHRDFPQHTDNSPASYSMSRQQPSNSTLSSGDALSRLRDSRYDELEVFLIGLDLTDLVGKFQQQLIDLSLLMTLTEQDLINAGVDQIGARKKILDAVRAVHKKGWEPSSLVSIHFNKKISCADAVAMVANSSKHLRYIGSTVVYVKEQLRRHPDTITQPTDTVSPLQLSRNIEDALKNVTALRSQLQILQSSLVKEMKKRQLEPADLVKKDGFLKCQRKQVTLWTLTLVISACLAASAYCYRDNLTVLPSKITGLFNIHGAKT
ncbi:unnamed protein product [Lymnaea stagnalis]|uniref:SAM domain-containing protein n=1 Tax=Lymnaea stagnalis TaxID=6523 RepID=A0AAV2HH43_LYMST